MLHQSGWPLGVSLPRPPGIMPSGVYGGGLLQRTQTLAGPAPWGGSGWHGPVAASLGHLLEMLFNICPHEENTFLLFVALFRDPPPSLASPISPSVQLLS